MVDSIGEALIRITVMLPIAVLITTSVKKVLLKPSLGTPSQVPASLINSERNTICLVPFGSHDLKNVFSTLYIFFVLEVIILNYSFICRKIPGYKLSLTKFL